MKLVSIIVPIYNVEKYLSRCIESLISQTYKKIEIILVNDGSPDNSKEVMEKYANNDKRIKCLYKENGGLSDARNYGLKYAKGDYICFIDSDDYVESDYVEKMYSKMKEENSDLVVCEFDRIYNKKTTYNKINYDEIKGFKVPAAWNKLFKKNIFEKYDIEFPKGIWYEDLATTSKYVMLSKKISIINENLYHYIQNEKSIMHTFDNRIFQIYDVFNNVEEFAKKNELFSENYENLEFANVYHVLVGTIFRASFHKDFSIEMIKNIVKYVEDKYPKWYNNNIAKKNLGFVYRVFLRLIKNKRYRLIYIALITFNKFMHL